MNMRKIIQIVTGQDLQCDLGHTLYALCGGELMRVPSLINGNQYLIFPRLMKLITQNPCALFTT